jgi:glycosyltransferase involved in cell wall biosynthesis
MRSLINMYIINLYPVATGGGLQNALSFLSFLKEDSRNKQTICFVRESSELEMYCKEFNLNYCSFTDGFFGRCKFELFSARVACKAIDAKCVFTLFSNPPFNLPKIKTISGYARSNVIEKDKGFWDFLPINKILKNRVLEFVNLKLISRSDVVILETEHLFNKAITNKVFGKSKIKVVEMAPSNLVLQKLDSMNPLNVSSEGVINILYLSGPHPNKNIHNLGRVMLLLNKSKSKKTYVLNVTLPDGSYLNSVLQNFQKEGASDYIVNRGSINQGEIDNVILDAHALINVARLESFSNNWVEAWASNRLLICADAEYARASCGNAAIYVNINDADSSAKTIIDIFDNESEYLKLVERGNNHLLSLPSSKDKYFKYWEIIESSQNSIEYTQ